MRIVIGRFVARPDQYEALRHVFDELLSPAPAEPGCIGDEVFVGADRPKEFVTVEHWRDAAAVESRMASARVACAFESGGPPLAAGTEIVASGCIA